MALSIVKARKAAWKIKSATYPKPTLEISDEALRAFSVPTIKIWNISISNLVTDHFGTIDITNLKPVLLRITPPVEPLRESILPELFRVLISLVAINIKREFTIRGERVEQDNDYLMCIEVFCSAINSLPASKDDQLRVQNLISWGNITCEVLNLEFESSEQLHQFLQIAQSFGLSEEHELCKLDITSETIYREANRRIGKILLNESLFKSGLVFNALQHQASLLNCYGGLLFLLAFAFSRSNNFRSANWLRRSGGIQNQLLQGNSILSSLSETSARELCELVDSKIRGGLDPNELAAEISQVVNQYYTHVPQLVALTSQAQFKGLTPLHVIGRAISERTEIPWKALFSRFVTLENELKVAHQFVQEIEGDPFAGIKRRGIAKEIKNLLYFCVRALIILGGEESLRRYAGYGGDNSQLAVPMKITLDAIIDRIKERQVKIAPYPSQYDESLSALASFIKGQFTINQGSGSSTTSDDNDQGPPKPGMSSLSVGHQDLPHDEPDLHRDSDDGIRAMCALPQS